MSQEKQKQYRRAIKRNSQKHYSKYIYDYVVTVCKKPFKVRLSYAWRVLRKRNPLTGTKVK